MQLLEYSKSILQLNMLSLDADNRFLRELFEDVVVSSFNSFCIKTDVDNKRIRFDLQISVTNRDMLSSDVSDHVFTICNNNHEKFRSLQLQTATHGLIFILLSSSLAQ
ncbi:Hypothetical_protein [Hexamita inflata]|uniref:Hypothetical_protein n=1 Tax=Hexamita inflata TaxID=28002 RepID=A0AA86N933_9EUKA|nr:Hypothetical protein HINF_LOCUS2872 [Hexamita inflata]